MAGRSARAVVRPLALALVAAICGRGEDAEVAPACFTQNAAYDDGKLAANAGYVSSAEQCQKNCQATPWCSVFTYRQGSAGATLGGCWNHDANNAILQAEDGAISGPKECPTVAPTPAPLPTPAPTPAPVTTAAPTVVVQTDTTGPVVSWFSGTRHILMLGAAILVAISVIVCCCLCCLRQDKPVKPEKKEQKKPHKVRPAEPTTSRDSPVSPPLDAATPSASFSENMPLLRVPGLTPPALPQPVLPPVGLEHLGLALVVPPLDVPLQPLRVPSVSATPSNPPEDAPAQALPARVQPGSFVGVQPGSFAGVQSGSFAGVQSGSFAGVPSGSFIMTAPPPAFGSSRFA